MIQCVSGASAAIQEREEFCMTRENTPTVKNTKKRRKLGTGGLTMTVGNKTYTEIIVTASDGEILAVISDTEIIEKNDVAVIMKDLT